MPLSSLFSWVRGDEDRSGVPSSLRADVEACERDQKHLASDIEALIRSYGERVANISRRLVRARTEGIRRKELDRLREEQEKLALVIRRLQASERSLRELEREYGEWADRARESGGNGEEMLKRAEIVASELRVRGREIADVARTNAYEGSAKDADPFESLVLEEESEESSSLREVSVCGEIGEDEEMVSLQGARDLPGLLEEVDVATSEARKLLRAPEDQDVAGIVSALADLRRHHANLRMHDRRHGLRRIRVEI